MKMPIKKVNELEKKHEAPLLYLIVEGKDEEYFFEKLFKHMSLEKQIKIWSLDGVDNMSNKLKVIQANPEFGKVSTLAIIRDADNSISSALQSTKDILRSLNLPVPENNMSFQQGDRIKTGVFIMPGENIEGKMLEDLCLSTKSDDINIELINEYLSKLKENGSTYPNNESKAKCLIYLASSEKVVNSIGIGAKKGYWNLDHSCLDDLKVFVNKI